MRHPKPCNISVNRTQPLHLLTYELNLSVIFDVIEGGADSGRLSVENGELAAVGFPRKCYDAFWKDRNKQ